MKFSMALGARIASSARSFIHTANGSIGMMFALILLVLLTSAGMAIDYGRQVRLSTMAQSALDAAVLSASSANIADSDRLPTFNAVFNENFKDTEPKVDKLDFTYDATDGGYGIAELTIPATISAVLGKSNFHATVESRANSGITDIEVALVLDVSGSMRFKLGGGSDTRMDALKAAAKKMIQTIEANRNVSAKIKYSIVPFTLNVNVGTQNASFVTDTNHSLFKGQPWVGCVLERPGTYAHDDTYDGSPDPSGGGKWHAYIWPPEPDDKYKCRNPGDGTNNGYISAKVPNRFGPLDSNIPGPNYNCVRMPIVPLTSSAADIEAAIDALEAIPNNGTIIAPGVAWGHRVLSPGEPFSGGEPFGKSRKIMILMTDGEQTTDAGNYSARCTTTTNSKKTYKFDPKSFGLAGDVISTYGPRDIFSPYGYIYDSAPTGATKANWNVVDDVMDQFALDACDRFKKRDTSDGTVELYTIAASKDAKSGTRINKLLRACATDKNHFFYVEDTQELAKAFETIAENAFTLHLTQ